MASYFLGQILPDPVRELFLILCGWLVLRAKLATANLRSLGLAVNSAKVAIACTTLCATTETFFLDSIEVVARLGRSNLFHQNESREGAIVPGAQKSGPLGD
jgi:hypothetical protein